MYPKYVLYYKFTDNMEDADHMLFYQSVQNVNSNIPENQRLSNGNIWKPLFSIACCTGKNAIIYIYLPVYCEINIMLKHINLYLWCYFMCKR